LLHFLKSGYSMKITKSSQVLIDFVDKNIKLKKCIQPRPIKRAEPILKQLYDDILTAYKSLQKAKEHRATFYTLHVSKITNPSQIIKPMHGDTHFFPKNVREHINKHSMQTLVYTFPLLERQIKVVFTIEQANADSEKLYNKYVEYIYMWLHILNTYSSKQCSQNLTIYLYFSSLNKNLPVNSFDVLDVEHVNTAFTGPCSETSEIVIYRNEEWFKVLMHESFHNFGLDFSTIDNTPCTNRMLKVFPVNSQVNLFESYCEFWAEIMNALFCSFIPIMKTNVFNFRKFLNNCEKHINLEINYSLFQLVKALNFMGLKYDALYSSKEYAVILRKNLYKENTNVLSYYVIKAILMVNYQETFAWCKGHNNPLLQFKQTSENLHEFCDHIEKHYNKPFMLNGVDCMQKVLHDLLIISIKPDISILDDKSCKKGTRNCRPKLKRVRFATRKNMGNGKKTNVATNNANFLMRNMRMSINELG